MTNLTDRQFAIRLLFVLFVSVASGFLSGFLLFQPINDENSHLFIIIWLVVAAVVYIVFVACFDFFKLKR